jgi:hypothetical protein
MLRKKLLERQIFYLHAAFLKKALTIALCPKSITKVEEWSNPRKLGHAAALPRWKIIG